MHVSSAAARASTRALAWSGALLFVLSLSYFLFSYTVTFAQPAIGGDWLGPVTWNVALFTVFAMHHSVFARERLRRWMADRVAPDLERSSYVWIASILFMIACALWRPVPGMAWDAHGLAAWILRGIQLAGVVLVLVSVSHIDPFELAGVRVRRSADVTFKTSGPYGRVRHPIYAGWVILVFATAPMTMTRLVFAVVSCVYVVIGIAFEERSLRAASGGAYDRYMQQVRWKLVPGVF